MPHRPRGRVLAGLVGAFLLLGGLGAAHAPAPVAALDRNEVRILAGAPSTFDPAAAGDVTAAAVTAQLYETLTTYDASLKLQPALAQSWDIAADGQSVVFHLRPDLEFSDGSPLTAQDVVGSWLRIIDPNAPAPLAALMLDVKGARDHITGRATDPALVGLKASGKDVEVQLEGPGSDFPAIVSSPLFGIVPPAAWRDGQKVFGKGGAVSGGYAVDSISDKEIVLTRNERYWAGSPAISTVRLVTDIDGRNPIAAFADGDLDWTEVSTLDAPWIPYDKDLGPQLRQTESLALTYMGFDTSRAPFNDVRVRQAFGAAVDWDRVVRLGGTTGTIPAISMVPPGIPGAGTANWLPVHDPDKARQLLAAAGYPNGAGLPTIQFAAGGLGIASGIQADLERELGVKIEIDQLDDAQQRLNADPPQMWATGWIADYLGPNDFLGVILGSDANDNYGRWSSPAFDQDVADALATRDPAAAQAAFERALGEVQRDVPVVPLYLGTDYALSRDGLLGAGSNGLGILRMAGMAWAQ
ncbi:MAG TPA: peptide ABC transporter substrate-binding protein [Candidatus Limnocylindrales bacterium]|nr:peptide ABC transporter substrate-binding protein [Candidatus Limnocylindrales bacterium]